MGRTFRVLGFVSAGVGLMYFLDPVSGRRRRGRLIDEWLHWRVRARSRYEQSRVYQRVRHHHERSLYGHSPYEPVLGDFDAGLHARVRAALRRVTRTPQAIEVAVREGIVTLRGTLPPPVLDRVLQTVSLLPGVVAIDDQLRPLEQAADRRAQLKRLWPVAAVLVGAIGAASYTVSE